MKTRLQERLRPTELIEARAAAESKPLPAPSGRLPEGWGRGMLEFLREQDADAEVRPLALTDWSARLAATFGAVDSATIAVAQSTRRAMERDADSYIHGVRCLTEPVLAELTELKLVQLLTWRQAVRVHAEAELALYDAESEAALAELAALAPHATLKCEGSL